MISANATRSTEVKQQSEAKSRQQPGGGVPKAAKRMGQDSEDRLRLQTGDEEKLAQSRWPQLQEE